MKKIIFLLMMLPILVIGQQNTLYQNNQITFTTTGDVKLPDSLIVGTLIQGVTIDSINALKLQGKSTVYDDLFFPFVTGSSGGGLYPPLVVDSMYYSFVVDSSGGSKCFEYFTIQIPHNTNTDTLHPHVHYKQEGANTPVFIMKYKWYNLGGTTAKGWKWVKMGTATGTTDKTMQIVKGGHIQGADNGITSVSSILICEIYLYSLAGGTAACNAYQFDLHRKIDAMGSKEEYVK